MRKIRREKSVYGRGEGVCINCQITNFEKREGKRSCRTQVLRCAEMNDIRQLEALYPVAKIMRRSICRLVFIVV